MKLANMDFLEISDYTGYEFRRPTEQEVDDVISQIAVNLLKQKMDDGKPVSYSKIPEEVDRIVKENILEIQSTSFVMDFKLVGKKIFVFHEMKVYLQDHEEIRSFIDHIFNGEENEFSSAVKKATTKHNHLGICFNYLLIHEDGTIESLKNGKTDVCLMSTQNKEDKK